MKVLSFKNHSTASQVIKNAFIGVIVCAALFSCKSIKQPQTITKPLDYTDQDVIENEIKTIREMQEKKVHVPCSVPVF